MDPSSRWGSINLFKNDPIHHVWTSLLFSVLLCCCCQFPGHFPSPASEQPPWMSNSWKHLLWRLQKEPLREKVSISVLCFQICPFKKSDITILNNNCLKTYKSPLGKSKSPEKNVKSNACCDVIYQTEKGSQNGHEETPFFHWPGDSICKRMTWLIPQYAQPFF